MPGVPTLAITALTKAKIPYTLRPYDHDPRTTAYGDEVVAALGQDPARVFKTLVASVEGTLVVGVVPVAAQLDLKALAAAVGGKKAAMAAVAEAERSSGYVAGGISPIGQRKPLKTILDVTAGNFSTIFVSAGRRGLQVEITATDLLAVSGGFMAAIATA